MSNLKFVDTHNMVVFLSKPIESKGFEQIVDFLNAHPIRYALTVNPTIYLSCIKQFWSSTVAETINREVQLNALVDGKRIVITETSVRRTLRLADAEGINCFSNSTIFKNLALMGPKTTAWNEFSSTMASVIICLATNQKFNFSKLIFDTMVRNLDNLFGKFLMYPRELTRIDTEIPQSSGPTKHVADEAVHKERGDSLMRATTTAYSLEVEQDSGNINKIQSKATLNEPSSPRTRSGSGPRCQETIGDNIAQTKFENVSTQSYDLLLARGNTLRSGEDSLKLTELMELCTNLQTKVLDLEKKKTTQANEIASLKRRVKKLEKKRSSRTHKLKRLYKVSLSARVESFIDEQSLGKDASKYGRINAIDADEDITLVSVHDMNMSADEEVGEEEVVKVINTAKLIVDAAQVSTAGDKVSTVGAAITVSAATTTTATTVEEITLAQALESLKTTKPKQKGVVIQELDESTTTRTISSQKSQDKIAREKAEKEYEANIALTEVWDDIQAKIEADHELAKRQQAEEQEQFTIEQKSILFKELLEQRRKHFATKRSEEKRNKPPTQAQQRKIIAFKRVNTFVNFRTNLVEDSSKRAGEKLEQESTKKQKVDEDKDISELQSLMKVIPDEEEVAIDVVPLATKPPTIVDWKIHKEGKNGYFKIIRADRSSKMYLVFSHMLKSFDREDLETLWKLVKAKHGSTRPEEGYERVLWGDLKAMFEPHVEDEIWKLQQRKEISPYTTYNYRYAEQEASRRIVGIKSLLNAASITVVLIDVNATQSKLVLLENFNKNYSKCLRLLYKVNATEGVNAASKEVSTAELVKAAPVISISSDSSEESVEVDDESLPGEQLPERHESLAVHDVVVSKWRDKVASRPSSPSGSSPHDTLAPSSEFPLAPVVASTKIRRQLAILIRPVEAIPFGRPLCTHLNGPHARKVFDNMSQRDVFIWNMMIQAYANLGFGNEALVVFKEMCGEGLGVDKFTYMFVLKACSVGSDVIMGRAFHGRVVKCGVEREVGSTGGGRKEKVVVGRRMYGDVMVVEKVVNLGFGDGGGRRVWRGKWDPLVGGRVEKLVVGRRRYGGMMVEEEVE
ncbi:retrovirus-related pol polyprotein from transposon TNT 1-94 [Tanacetum coccineum]|uniref:Retrovirus-related pol polyprotein from transposon TNT 1-94 n=1 Tax=Tanacetum coccineum TaxID=301880 RepID=A0ABQ4XJE2_9ASTR